MTTALLPFVQVELAGTTGLDAGRYLARNPERVLVVRVAGASSPARRLLRKPRPKHVEPATEPPMVPVTTLTMIRAEPLGGQEQAARWLAAVGRDEDAIEKVLDDALRTANRALHAQRTAALDPFLADVAAEHALTIRIGFGTGEALADGRWSEAIELPRGTRRRRLEALGPQEKIAAVLGGRDAIGPAEAAILRARADLDAGRWRDATLQVRTGVDALVADRERFSARGQEDDLGALGERQARLASAATEALGREPTESTREVVTETLKLCERILRRQRAYG